MKIDKGFNDDFIFFAKSFNFLVALLVLFMISIIIIYGKYTESQRIRYETRITADELRQSSDDLTRMARTYVITGNEKFEKMYWDILAIRNGELERPERYEDIYWDFYIPNFSKPRPDAIKQSLHEKMISLGFTSEELGKLEEAEKHSNDLVWTERIAMNAMKGIFLDDSNQFAVRKDPNVKFARELMFNEKYHQDKALIMNSIDEFFVMLNSRTENSIYLYTSLLKIFLGIISAIILGIIVISIRKVKILKAAKSNLENLTRELKYKKAELEEVIYVTSHDLRSPLVNIMGFSKELELNTEELLKFVKKDKDCNSILEYLSKNFYTESASFLKYIFNSTEKMERLLDGLLIMSQMGQMTTNRKSINMNELMEDVIKNFKNDLKNNNVNFSINNLPPCYGDEEQINQLFSNLIDNAIKFMDKQRSGVIKINGKTENSKVYYSIEDNGIGFSNEHNDKIFELFHRLNPDYNSGVGLGLTIVNRILKRNNGAIVVDSKPGVGSKFTVIFNTN